MSTGLDSTEVFKACLKRLRLENYLKKFTKAEWDTLGDFAFAVAFQPGAGATEEEMQKVIYAKILDETPADVLELEPRRGNRLCRDIEGMRLCKVCLARCMTPPPPRPHAAAGAARAERRCGSVRRMGSAVAAE